MVRVKASWMVMVMMRLGCRYVMMLLLCLLMMMVTTAASTACVIVSCATAATGPTAVAVLFLLYPLLQVDLGVAFLFIRASKLPATDVTGEGFLAGVCPNVGRQVVRPAEGSHADSALERLLSGVNSDMSGKLVRSRETSITVFHRARVWSLVDRGFTGAVGILSRFNRYQLQGHGTLLVHLVQNFVPLAGGRIVLR